MICTEDNLFSAYCTIFPSNFVAQPFDARLDIKILIVFAFVFRWLTQPAIVNAFYSPNHNSISKLGPNEYFLRLITKLLII